MRSLPIMLCALLGTAAAATPPALAQLAAPLSARNDATAPAAAYWTPERLRGARPRDLPRSSALSTALGSPPAAGPSVSSPAGLPTYRGRQPEVRLLEPVALGGDRGPAGEAAPATPLAAGSVGLRFTNERVVPMRVLRGVYPWKATGKLFFVGADGGAYVCSGSVVRQRVVATAGHCVFDAAAQRFHTGFFFVPGYDNGASPFGGFGHSFVATTGSWAGGGGGVPNAADFGVLVMQDKVVGGRPRRIGELTGWLAWRTNALAGNNVSAMGYPCNLDACQVLQRTSAEAGRRAVPNSAEIGSDHRGGASGGPWVQDWGVSAADQPARPLGGNVLVGITSYGPLATEPRYLGSSILNAEWVQIFNRACAQPRACS